MFFDQFKYLCQKNNTTPTTVVVKLGIGKGTMSQWKNGSTPNGDTLVKIAEYFDAPTDFLLERGIFASWDVINKHWDMFVDALFTLIPGLEEYKDQLPMDDKIRITHAAAFLISKIIVNEQTGEFRVVYFYDKEPQPAPTAKINTIGEGGELITFNLPPKQIPMAKKLMATLAEAES